MDCGGGGSGGRAERMFKVVRELEFEIDSLAVLAGAVFGLREDCGDGCFKRWAMDDG